MRVKEENILWRITVNCLPAKRYFNVKRDRRWGITGYPLGNGIVADYKIAYCIELPVFNIGVFEEKDYV